MTKYVYLFKEGSAKMRELLGGKGANLAEMTNIGLPVPQGFTVTTEACIRYYEDGQAIGQDIVNQIDAALKETEIICNKKFGDLNNPFLVSVRSGARASMPGMMDTILNLGLNDIAVQGLANQTGNERFAYDSYRRFIQMFSDVVMEVKKALFEGALHKMKEDKGRALRYRAGRRRFEKARDRVQGHLQEGTGRGFPAGSQGAADGIHQSCVPLLG